MVCISWPHSRRLRALFSPRCHRMRSPAAKTASRLGGTRRRQPHRGRHFRQMHGGRPGRSGCKMGLFHTFVVQDEPKRAQARLLVAMRQ